jgi:hypothetical protein
VTVVSRQITEYKLSPEELAEIHRKYGLPNTKPDKHNCFISANRKPPLVTEAKKKPKTEKVKAVVVKPPRESKPKKKPKAEAQPRTRQLTKEELEDALEKGGTIEEARNILRIGNGVIRRFIRQYGIVQPNQHLVHKDESGRVCTSCNVFKQWSEFNKNSNPNAVNGRESSCRECSNAYRRERRRKKREQLCSNNCHPSQA